MNHNFKINNKTLKLISASISLVIVMGGCSLKNETTKSETTNEYTQTTSATSEVSTLSNNQIENDTMQQVNNTSDDITAETQLYTCPIEYNDQTLLEFAQYMEDNGYSAFESNLPMNIGYDNPALQQLLINFCEEKTGQYDASITVDNFHYFQYSVEEIPSFGATSSNNPSDFADFFFCLTPAESELLRATLIETNTRFIVDEIPYSYFEQRFPEFVSDLSPESYNNIKDQYIEIGNRIYNYDTCNYDLSNLSDYEYDVFLFCTCAFYNRDRNMLFQSCEIPQIRNLSTGRLELNPNDLRLSQLHESYDEFIGGDITQVETREHFYETYGMYPEDALYRETRYEGNVTETNTMYATAPSRQR